MIMMIMEHYIDQETRRKMDICVFCIDRTFECLLLVVIVIG